MTMTMDYGVDYICRVPEAAMPQDGNPIWRVDDVAREYGVQPRTIVTYRLESNPVVGQGDKARPGRFVDDPFPKEDDTVGRAPWWRPERKPEFDAWFGRHPRRTVGDGIGGRPKGSGKKRSLPEGEELAALRGEIRAEVLDDLERAFAGDEGAVARIQALREEQQ